MDLESHPQKTGLQCTWFFDLLLKSDFCMVNVIKKQRKEGENKFLKFHNAKIGGFVSRPTRLTLLVWPLKSVCYRSHPSLFVMSNSSNVRHAFWAVICRERQSEETSRSARHVSQGSQCRHTDRNHFDRKLHINWIISKLRKGNESKCFRNEVPPMSCDAQGSAPGALQIPFLALALSSDRPSLCQGQ